MRRSWPLAGYTVLLLTTFLPSARAADWVLTPVDAAPDAIRTWSGQAKAPADSFVLYGGPGSLLGKFQDATGLVPDAQGWVGHDRTDLGTPPYAGDFSKVIPLFADIDECTTNLSPQFSFIDDGSPPNNPGYMGTGTGGTTSTTMYGVPGHFVVPFDGGVFGGVEDLDNEILSPPIAWDLPGPADDLAIGGAFLRFDMWLDLPLANGIFYRFAARSYEQGSWGAWNDYGLALYGTPARYVSQEWDISGLVAAEPESIQVALGVIDLAAEFGLPGLQGTPSPVFDNVTVGKYAAEGPLIVARTPDMFATGFPVNPITSFVAQADRNAADVRVDMARDISTGSGIVRGDSMVVMAFATTPGASIQSVEMHYRLSLNPVFEAAIRANAPVTGAGMGYGGTDLHAGTIVGSATGTPNQYFFDLPDTDFMYPGDHLRYYLEATETSMRSQTLPGNTDDFEDPGPPPITVTCPTPKEIEKMIADGTWWEFQNSAKPSTWTDINDPPGTLVFGGGSNDAEEELYLLHQMFQQLGYVHRVDYEYVDVRELGVSHGLGAQGGSMDLQLEAYDVIIVMAGAHDAIFLSDGSNSNGYDKSDDLGMLTAWHAQNAHRSIIYFGDNLASYLNRSLDGATYLDQVMGVTVSGGDVSATVGSTSPSVGPAGLQGFAEAFAVLGTCPDRRTFDVIQPGPTATVGHVFTGGATASVVFDRMVSGFRKVDITFPFGFDAIADPHPPSTTGVSKRALLLGELLTFVGAPGPSSSPTALPGTKPGLSHISNVAPNPFNPNTVVELRLEVTGPVSLEIFDTRGRRVRTLLDEVRDAGHHSIGWNGRDDTGRRVATGQYFLRLQTSSGVDRRKLTLLK